MSALSSVESSLENIYKGAPKLPEKAKETITSLVPWLNLILGVLGVLSALTLWHWAHVTNGLVDYVNNLSLTYGTGQVVSARMNAAIWIGLIVLVIESLIYLAAFAPTKERKLKGWNLMFYAVVLNTVYGFALLFTDYGSGIGSFIGYLIGTAIGLYFLFQIKPKYS